MDVTTYPRPTSSQHRRSIGPIGIASRIIVGLGFLALAVFVREPDPTDALLGLVVFPAVAIGLLGWRARRYPAPLDATGQVAECLNVIVFLPLFFAPATAGGAFIFYGTSMLVAAARRSGGCEVTAVANLVLGRDDHVGCVLFGPVDAVEAARR